MSYKSNCMPVQSVMSARNHILKKISQEKSNKGGILVSKSNKYGKAYDYVYAADTVHDNYYVFEGRGYDTHNTGDSKAVNLMVQKASAYFNYKFHYNTAVLRDLQWYIQILDTAIFQDKNLYVVVSPVYETEEPYVYCIKGKMLRNILSCFSRLNELQLSGGVSGTMSPSLRFASDDGEVIARVEKVPLCLVNQHKAPYSKVTCSYLWLNPDSLLFAQV